MKWLWPLGIAYGAVSALRVTAFRVVLLRASRAAGPVISVGNLSVGGSGKTPMVEWVAKVLHEAGLPVAILSRGYGGSYGGAPLVVADAQSVRLGADMAGDEPVMLARALPGVPVLVGHRRDEAARLAESSFGPRVHVLDDGFQHLRLARDLDLVCAAPEDFQDRPLPAGRLREFPGAVRRAHAVLLHGEGQGPAGLETWRVRRRVLGCVDLEGRDVAPPRRPWLVSGIARPERFHADVAATCAEVTGRNSFPDHHAFSSGEWQAVGARARAATAVALLNTAKDAVRLPPDPGAALPVLVLRIGLEFENEVGFRERLLAVARSVA